jgi:hypothetical protein
MNPVSLSSGDITWTTLPALLISVCMVTAMHWAWNWVERKYFPDPDEALGSTAH